MKDIKHSLAADENQTPITEDDFIEALKKASRPVEDQEPIEDDESDDGEETE